MRLLVAIFAACTLAVAMGGCGTGSSSPAPGPPRHTPTPKPTPTPAGTPTPTAPPGTPAFNNWTTYGFDNFHDGFNPNTSTITVAAIPNLHLAWQTTVPDVRTQTQPILATKVGTHEGVLIVGGASGNVYAYDALTGDAIWQTPLGNATFDCPGVAPVTLGIGGSAVYDPGNGSIYVGSNLNSTGNGPTQDFITQLNVANGAVLGKVQIDPGILTGEVNFTHTSLTLADGILYAGTGSTCDISSWRGRIAAVNEASMTLASTFFTVWNQTQAPTPAPAPYSGGGVWGWGGVSIGSSGNVWAAVGNVDTQTGSTGPQPPFVEDLENEYDAFGEHVLQLTPNLATVLQSNYPVFTFNDTLSRDLDLSGTPILGHPVGCDEMLGVQGKSGDLYVYDATNISVGPITRYKFTSSSYEDPNLGNPAFSPLTGLFYANVASGVSGGVLPAPGMIAIKACNSTSSIVWSTQFGADSMLSGTPRTMPTVTAGGVVFDGTPCRVDGNGGCTGSGDYGGAIWALDASSGALLNGGKPIITTPKAIHMGVVVDADWVYVFDQYGDMYGLTIDPRYPAISQSHVRRQAP